MSKVSMKVFGDLVHKVSLLEDSNNRLWKDKLSRDDLRGRDDIEHRLDFVESRMEDLFVDYEKRLTDLRFRVDIIPLPTPNRERIEKLEGDLLEP